MSKNRAKRTGILLLIVCILASSPLSALADTDTKLDEASERIDSLEQKQEDEKQELDNLEQYQSGLTGDLEELNSELSRISGKMETIRTQINEKNTEIADKEVDIEEQQKVVDQQYEDMKKRIRYMYENEQESPFTILLSADSFADFLNQTEYVIAIQRYDRKKLSEYQLAQEDLENDKVALESKKEELIVLQTDLQTEQDSVNVLIADKQAKISEADALIASSQADIAAYEEQIAQQKAYEEELERQKEQEEAARLAQIKEQEANDVLGEIVVTEGDQALMAAIIECEAGGESYEGKIAVGSVVMNRVASSHFPNSVVEVIYQSGQFSPVASGRFATVLGRGASAECQQAAADVLGGSRNVNCLYFRRNTGVIQGTVIGNHVFF